MSLQITLLMAHLLICFLAWLNTLQRDILPTYLVALIHKISNLNSLLKMLVESIYQWFVSRKRRHHHQRLRNLQTRQALMMVSFNFYTYRDFLLIPVSIQFYQFLCLFFNQNFTFAYIFISIELQKRQNIAWEQYHQLRKSSNAFEPLLESLRTQVRPMHHIRSLHPFCASAYLLLTILKWAFVTRDAQLHTHAHAHKDTSACIWMCTAFPRP